jgi:hypothetical protein
LLESWPRETEQSTSHSPGLLNELDWSPMVHVVQVSSRCSWAKPRTPGEDHTAAIAWRRVILILEEQSGGWKARGIALKLFGRRGGFLRDPMGHQQRTPARRVFPVVFAPAHHRVQSWIHRSNSAYHVSRAEKTYKTQKENALPPFVFFHHSSTDSSLKFASTASSSIS